MHVEPEVYNIFNPVKCIDLHVITPRNPTLPREQFTRALLLFKHIHFVHSCLNMLMSTAIIHLFYIEGFLKKKRKKEQQKKKKKDKDDKNNDEKADTESV